MTFDQGLLFGLLALILAMLLWGRVRYDLVAAGGLLLAVVLGLVPQDRAFSGFSNSAVLVVALVLVASRAFENSGALAVLTQRLAANERSTAAHIAVTAGLAAALSAVINNVAALALLMPLDVQAARKAGRPPGLTLMPLAFATILGGMVTLIGTPPNIIASTIRAERLGAPYQMFDFTPVGLVVAVVGVAFVALVGWRLVPRREDKAAKLVRESSFKAELFVPEGSPSVGRTIAELEGEAESADVLMLGLIRGNRQYHGRARMMAIAPEDLLVVEGSTDAIAALIKAVGLQEPKQEEEEADGKAGKQAEAAAARAVAGDAAADGAEADAEDAEKEEEEEEEKVEEPAVIEAVVHGSSRLIGRSARGMALRSQFRVTLLGIARAGTVTRAQVQDRRIEAGDVLLLTGRGAASAATLDLIGVIPINRVSVAPFRPVRVGLAVGLFAAAIVAATTGWLSFTVAIAIAVAGYAATRLVPAREFYQQIEWPVIVMLACLLPIGEAFDNVGGTQLIAGSIASLTRDGAPVVALVALMVVTMTLSDALNNVATMVITAPIAIDLAGALGVNPDTFLMGVAVSASCAFLTPIGHKNNTLIMGPGGFRFSDYWPMGLPLELVVLAVSVPMLLVVWPL